MRSSLIKFYSSEKSIEKFIRSTDPENWHAFWKKQENWVSAWETSIKPQDWGYRVNAVDFSFLKKRISRVDTISRLMFLLRYQNWIDELIG